MKDRDKPSQVSRTKKSQEKDDELHKINTSKAFATGSLEKALESEDSPEEVRKTTKGATTDSSKLFASHKAGFQPLSGITKSTPNSTSSIPTKEERMKLMGLKGTPKPKEKPTTQTEEKMDVEKPRSPKK